MTDITYGLQLRNVGVTDLVAQYQIEMHLTERGELPDKHVFLKSIIDENDPMSDRLKRVCRVGDMVSYPKDRSEAIKQRIPVWRDSLLIKVYDSVSDANVAAKFLIERVNALVTEFITYTTEFEADPGELLTFPEADLGILQPLIGDYYAKIQEVEDKEKEIEDIDADCARTDEKYNDAVNALAVARATLEALNNAHASLASVYAGIATFQGQAAAITNPINNALSAWADVGDSASQDVRDAMVPILEDPSGSLHDAFFNSFQAGVSTFNQRVSVVSSQVSELIVEISEQETRRGQAKTTRDTLLTAKEECTAEKSAAQASLATLEAQAADLLSSIVDLCPDFTPEST